VERSTTESNLVSPALALRPLSIFWLASVLLLACLLGELAVRQLYERPGHLMTVLANYETSASTLGPHVVSFGTCLGDAMVPDVVEKQWDAGIKVMNLGSRASTPLDWYLITWRRLAEDPNLKAIVVAFGPSDLTLRPSPWESHVMELATWRDLRTLIRYSCDSPSCAIEMILHRASAAYRMRGFLGNAFWDRLGIHPPGPKLPEALGPGPANLDGRARPAPLEPYRAPEGENAPAGEAVSGEKIGMKVATFYPGNDLQTQVNPKGLELGWHAEESWMSRGRDPYIWIRLLMAAAKQRRIQVIFVPVPGNPARENELRGWYDPVGRSEIKAVVAAGGGTILDPSPIQGLEPQHYVDDVHYTAEGARVIAAGIGRALRAKLGSLENSP